jgi:methylmalonyl-CoA/ethylmalonyl-CoA epimerase
MIQQIDHIGIAVKSLAQAVPRYEQALGLKCSGVEEVPAQGVRVAFLPVGELRIELLEATSEASPIARFIARRGEGIHHVAFRSDSLAGDVRAAVGAGCVHLNQLAREGAGDAEVAFFHPAEFCGVLVEFCGKHPN